MTGTSSIRRRQPLSSTSAHSKGKNTRLIKPDPGSFGNFESPIVAKWLPDGRKMSLVNASVFHQKPEDVTWIAPIGTLTDGASIPPIFWDVIGGPFEGKYRDAAVNHDYECCKKIHPWRDVHRMFYDGMMANGEEMWRAKLMYFAVYFFGPRWPTEALRPRPRFTEGDIARAAHVFKNEPTIALEDIEALSSAKLRAKKGLVPGSVRGWQLLDDEKIVKPFKREGPCTE